MSLYDYKTIADALCKHDYYMPTEDQWQKQFKKLSPSDPNVYGGVYEKISTTTLPKPTEEPMITLERSNRNLKGAYQTCINLLLQQAQSHQDKAAAVNIFDGLRLIELGKAKVLKQAAERIQDMVDFSGCTEYE